MIKQISQLSPIICLLLLSACLGTTVRQERSSTPGHELSSLNQAFVDSLQHRINEAKIIPEFARLKQPILISNKPTLAFRVNQGTVLQFNIYGYPDPKGTKAIVAPLIKIGVSVSDQHEISLSGIEVIFHRRENYNPMQIWANTSSWKEGEIFLTPLIIK